MRFTFFSLLFLLSLTLFSLGKSENQILVEEKGEVRLTGILKFVGSEPFIELVIVSEGSQYRITGDREQELKKLQLKRVSVRGILLPKEGRLIQGIAVTDYELLE